MNALVETQTHCKLPLTADDVNPPQVLLAEDDDRLRALLATTLRRDGFEVHEARSGAELLEWIDEIMRHTAGCPLDLVIADIRMPSISGLEALASLRDRDWATPVILMTAFGDPETHAEALRLGAATVFDKPFELADLRAAALHYVGGDYLADSHR